MNLLRVLWHRLAASMSSRRRDAELREEIEAHLDLLASDHQRSGLSRPAARAAARRDFGGFAQMREAHRDLRGSVWIDGIRQDLRYAVRSLFATPGFTAATLVTLIVAIGASATVYSLLDTLLLRPLPVRNPEQLVSMSLVTQTGQERGLSIAMFEELEREQRSFSGMFAYTGGTVATVETDAGIVLTNLWSATGTFHTELGQTPFAGRLLTVQDAEPQAGTNGHVAVLSHSYWQRNYGGSPSAIGREVVIEGHPFTIVGVTRAGFGGMGLGEEADVTIPLPAYPVVSNPGGNNLIDLRDRRRLFIRVIGRTRADVSLDQARAEFARLWPDVRDRTIPPAYQGTEREAFMAMTLALESAERGVEYFLRNRFTRPLRLLVGVVALVLLVACVHLASLMLARAATRAHELSLRTALGASRWRVARGHLIESLLLSLAGAVTGLALSGPVGGEIASFMTQQYTVRPTFDFTPGLRVSIWTLGTASVAGMLFGLAPALFATRRDPATVLQRHARAGGAVSRIGHILIASQVALSLAVVSGAGLMARSLQKARTIETGYERTLFVSSLKPRPGGYIGINRAAYYRDLTGRIGNLPGVQAATVSNLRPGRAWTLEETVSLTGRGSTEPIGMSALAVRGLGPEFFDTAGIPILRGRDFAWTDDGDRPRVAMINRALATLLFADGDAIGATIRVGETTRRQQLLVTGVVADSRLFDPRDEPAPAVYLPALQEPEFLWGPFLIVRSARQIDPAAIEGVVDRLGREFVAGTDTLATLIDETLVVERLMVMLGAFFSVTTLLLAAIGLHGVVSFSVARSTREIGIRMALGAPTDDVVRGMVRRALVPVAIGLAIGLPVALASSRAIRGLLFGVAPGDPLALAAASILLLSVGLVAAWLPARRASRIEPTIALRCD